MIETELFLMKKVIVTFDRISSVCESEMRIPCKRDSPTTRIEECDGNEDVDPLHSKICELEMRICPKERLKEVDIESIYECKAVNLMIEI
jgi:hypothetical protein